MGDALCGPSNALQNFQKHASVDRTLQQDRLTSRQPSSQGFRSQDANQGALDPEFAAFESNFSGPPLPDIHHAGPFVAPTPHHPMPGHMENHNWASDFQRLKISGPSHPVHQQPGPSAAPMSAPQQGWQNEFMIQQQQQQQTPVQQQPQHQPFGYGFQPSIVPNYSMGGASMNTYQPQMATETQQPPAETFDESAFEAAFEQARADMDLEATSAAQANTENINETLQSDVAAEPGAHEEIRIGSDTISYTEKEDAQGRSNDGDELARTAGHLLDSVSHEKNQKFQQSNFLALMRRIRDREVHIEGDEFRELMIIQTAQSLHPGGKYYPQDNKPQQTSAPENWDGSAQVTPDGTRPNLHDPATLTREETHAPLAGRGNGNPLHERKMLPPSNSFLHQSLKLAEVTANIQSQETLTPPPPYSVSQPPNPGLRETQSDEIDIDDDEASWDTTATNPNPVTIHIDASIGVRGNSNTIIMSSGTGTQQPKPASTQSTTPPPPTTNSMTSATTVLQTAQKHRQNKLTEMATSILAALQSSRDLPQGSNGRGTPIEININTGVNIEGRKNVICAGAGTGAARMLPRRDNNQNESDEDESGSKRKRRAQSEPTDTPKAKKECLSSSRTN